MNKVEKVMKEFKGGDLKSSSGQKVTNPKQAIAIGLSEQRRMKGMAKGGEMKESKDMMKKEVGFMKAKGAPKSMIKHEEAEMKSTKKMAMGGMSGRAMPVQANVGGASRGLDRAAAMSGRAMPAVGMKSGGKAYSEGGRMTSKGEHPVQTKSKRGAEMIKMASGGLAAGHKSADGIAKRGKTRGKEIAMKMGGKC